MDDPDGLHDAVVAWYAGNARDLPWRRGDATAWGVLVSEVMLQQTPVARVLPVWQEWMVRWPTAADLAAVSPGEAVRAWGKLGYPRRALRLHEAAAGISDRFGGVVPSSYDDLRTLAGIGDYTAAAVAAFAYGRRHVVLDTNVRRVLARVVTGADQPAPSITRGERRVAHDLLPADGREAATWSVAVMELGALVCRPVSPRCGACPARDECAWLAAGRPAYDGPRRKPQAFAGTDRQCRGRLMDVLRGQDGPATRAQLDGAWHEAEQRDRCLESLLADGLASRRPDGTYALP
jgi:A/G-specific adenine glycosylase